MKILILEDNQTDADLCVIALKRSIKDCSIDLVNSLFMAQQKIRSGIFYDIALLDLNLPDGNGLELLTEIREANLSMAVIVFTSSGNEEIAVAALKAGADDYVAKKPGYLHELSHTINFAISTFRQNQKQKAEIINVLYIEYNSVDIDVAKLHFKRYAPNFRLEIVPTGEQALKVLQQSEGSSCKSYPHVILLDYHVPGMSALDFIKIIRQEKMLEVPVIIISGTGDEDIAVQALKLGANDYVTKSNNYLFRLPFMVINAFNQGELKMKQLQLAESESKYRLLAENSGDVIFTMNKDLNFTYISPAVKSLRGFDPKEALKQHLSDVLTMSSLEIASEIINEYFTIFSENTQDVLPERTLELELTRKDGTTVWAEVKASLLKNECGNITGIVGVSRDITKRRQAIEVTRKLSRAVEQSHESILITNTEGIIEYCNPSVIRTSGYTKEEILGQNPRLFKSGNTPANVYKDIWDTINSGNVWEGEFQNRNKNDDLYWEASSITPVLDSSGKITHYLAIKRDVTDQKKMNEQLALAKGKAEDNHRLKLALLTNLSHEVRTPMNAIMGFSDLMKDSTFDEKDTYAEIILESSKQLLSLIDDIILLSRLQSENIPISKTAFNPGEFIKQIIQRFSYPDLRSEIKIIPIIPEKYNSLRIESDKEKITQIISNLISNASKYTIEGSIKIGFDVIDNSVAFYVEDTGIGIPETEHQKIFETFYRGEQAITRAIRGTGLGLNIAQESAKRLHGNISVNSQPGAGSRFTLSIPFHPVIETVPVKPQVNHLKTKDIIVLIVDDEPFNIKYLEELLKGYVKRTDNAANGKEAVQMASQYKYDLILMDSKMPLMSGAEATKILKKLYPNLPIIAQTAFASQDDIDRLIQSGCDDFIVKPINKYKLLELISQRLDFRQ